MTTIRVTVTPSFQGKRGQSTETRRGWTLVLEDNETGRVIDRRVRPTKSDAYAVARSYCRRHGHGMLTPKSA